MTTVQQLQAEISAEERAIRHLIGERAATTSKIKRLEAKLKLQRARLHKLEHKFPRLAVASRFPDVSNNQPSVSVIAVRHASDLRIGQLLVTKATEGTGFVDGFLASRAKAMTAAGFPRRGFYAYLHPSEGGTAQAEFLLSALDHAGVTIADTDIIVADVETTDGQAASTVKACAADFGAHIAQHTPAQRWLYGGGPFLSENGVTLDGYEWHWLAAYVPDPRPFEVFGPARTKAWQFTDGHFGPQPHDCPGIGPCDLSVVLR